MNISADSRMAARRPKMSASRPPQHRAHCRARQRHQRQHAGGLLADLVLGGHARHHEAQRGRLQDVDRQRDHQHDHQLPVLAVQRHAVGDVELQVAVAVQALLHLRDARHEAVHGQEHAKRDHRHAGQHGGVHLHADHLVARMPAHH
jgi:hypothetical protein